MNPQTGKTYALLIGIDRPESDGLRPLEFAVADVQEFASLLQQRLGKALDECRVLTCPPEEDCAVPRRSEILRQLDHFRLAPMTADDTFILYFAGHGFSLGNKQDADTFLLAADSDHGSHDLLKATAITLADLKIFLRGIRAGQQLVILDACRNDPTIGCRSLDDHGCDDVVTRDIVALAKPEGLLSTGFPLRRSVLSACWTGGRSHEYRGGGHSWFCHHLLEAIREHPGTDLALTPEWAEAIGVRMKSTAWKLLPPAADQAPHLEVEGAAISLHLFHAPRNTPRSAPMSSARGSSTKGWALAAAYYLATLIPIQTIALIGIRAGAAVATARGWITLDPAIVSASTVVFSLAAAWWAANGLAIAFGLARRNGTSIPGQVVAHMGGFRQPGTSARTQMG